MPSPVPAPLALAWTDAAGAHRVDLTPDRPIVLGRGAGCDVMLAPLTVSRRHASVSLADGGYILCPLSRTSPTRHNGRVVVRDVRLAPGDVIELATVRLDVVVHDPR